jgi:hypothetical protein
MEARRVSGKLAVDLRRSEFERDEADLTAVSASAVETR